MRNDFPGPVSYNRFVELMQTALLPLAVFLKTRCLGKCTGISYVDSSHIKVCHIKRAHSHKVLKGLATKGQCSIGWFFRLMLHFIITTRERYLILCSLLVMSMTDILFFAATYRKKSMESFMEIKDTYHNLTLKSSS